MEYSEAKARLRWLCGEMVARVSGPDGGPIDVFFKEAAELALYLGFPSPPIHKGSWQRSQAPCFEPGFVGDVTKLTQGQWMELHADITSVRGYVLRDPASPDVFQTAMSDVEWDFSMEPSSLSVDFLVETAIANGKRRVASALRLWIRAIDGLPEGGEGPTEEDVPDEEGEEDQKRKGPLRIPYEDARKRVNLLQKWADVQDRNEGKPKREGVKKAAFLRGKPETEPDMKAAQVWYHSHVEKGEFPSDPRKLKDEKLRKHSRS